jgi:hypothetical protein
MRMQVGADKAALLSLLVLGSLQGGCTAASSVDKHCASVGYKFFHNSRRAEQEFSTFPLPKKYDVLICASQGIHPPNLTFAALFATEGSAGAAFLKKRLAETSEDATVRDITYALLQMQERKTYDVLGDRELVFLLQRKIAAMKSEAWRGVASGQLERLRALPNA